MYSQATESPERTGGVCGTPRFPLLSQFHPWVHLRQIQAFYVAELCLLSEFVCSNHAVLYLCHKPCSDRNQLYSCSLPGSSSHCSPIRKRCSVVVDGVEVAVLQQILALCCRFDRWCYHPGSADHIQQPHAAEGVLLAWSITIRRSFNPDQLGLGAQINVPHSTTPRCLEGLGGWYHLQRKRLKQMRAASARNNNKTIQVSS
jgi:hypothetical protein